MRVYVNGEARAAAPESTVAALLRELGIGEDQPGVAVARNGNVVRRNEWSAVRLAEGDRLEVIRATQGG
jgi:sulfur carrier protein